MIVMFLKLLFLLVIGVTPVISAPCNTTALLSQLNATLDGRIRSSEPLAAPCFSEPGGARCLAVKKQLKTPLGFYHSSKYQGFQYMQGEACLADPSDQCLLEPGTLNTPGNASCSQGLVSSLYIEINKATDVPKIFEYARKSGTALSIKNSGHDYVMRSSRRGSLAIWTRGLQEKEFHASFVPAGCSSSRPTTAITFGAGVNTDEAVTFAHDNGFVFDGGSASTIGVSGGWLLNGGHSVLSNSIGLGVDRVVQLTIVTGDGEVRIANECQNSELFWALRGGGSGTFGVILNSTFRVEQEAPMTAAILGFEANAATQKRFVEILAENIQSWALEGWGGPVGPNLAILVNPRSDMNVSTASQALAPLVTHTLAQKGKADITSYASYYDFYRAVINGSHAAFVPVSMAVMVTSRIIPETVFANDTTRASMVDVIMDLQNSGLAVSMLSTMPFLYGRNHTHHTTSMHPAWYRSVWSVIGYAMWKADSPFAERQKTVTLLKEGTESLKKLAPEGCTYANEGYAWLSDWSQEFWGDNHAALLELKRRYDPDQLLSCWHCVGWDESQPNYECISGLAPRND
ncbi:uncharacterized protein B0H64DRAFT_322615 [Chaetomium fimeti]|uniref:FAD-binding PCMH-type domain-containing protein n=1 Tax=Chaetomium fimeti TaxID=1854472 RepID=A0AAE0HHD6_9PEZI|nr:hypothetical protein B0H64DRAFT_322615 [Chaetomium fimeti]